MFFGFFCFLFSIFNYLKDFSKKCWITALVRLMKKHWGFKPVFRCSKTKTTKTTHKTTQIHVEHKGATDIKKQHFFVYFGILNFLNDFSNNCWVTALLRSMTFIWGWNQLKSIANLTLSQHFLEKKTCIVSLQYWCDHFMVKLLLPKP